MTWITILVHQWMGYRAYLAYTAQEQWTIIFTNYKQKIHQLLYSLPGIMVTGPWILKHDFHHHYHTWISNNGCTKKELDFILACHFSFTIIQSYQLFHAAKAPKNTDHKLLIAKVRFHLLPQHKHISSNNTIIHWSTNIFNVLLSDWDVCYSKWSMLAPNPKLDFA